MDKHFMGKNKKSKIEILDPNLNKTIQLDSLEEWQVYNWVLELYNLGVILEYEYQPEEFQLSPKYQFVPAFNNPKNKEKSLLQSHEYTADFKLVFDVKFGEVLSAYFKISKNMVSGKKIIIYIDIKGTFQPNGGARTFSINQKLVFEKYGIYVQKVVPKDMFKILGIPLRCLKGYKGKPSRIYSGFNFVKRIFGFQ